MLVYDAERAPTNDPHEFLAFCGVVGLGKLLAEGKIRVLKDLRQRATDPRWRVKRAQQRFKVKPNPRVAPRT